MKTTIKAKCGLTFVLVEGEKPTVKMFRTGKEKKPIAFVWVGNLAGARNWINNQIAQEQDVQKREAEATARTQDEFARVGPGSILYASWGYDQTNIDYFKVLDRNGSTLTLVEIESKRVDKPDPKKPDSFTRKVMPDPEKETGKPFKKRIGKYGIKIDCKHLYPCDPWTAKVSTSYA